MKNCPKRLYLPNILERSPATSSMKVRPSSQAHYDDYNWAIEKDCAEAGWEVLSSNDGICTLIASPGQCPFDGKSIGGRLRHSMCVLAQSFC